VFNGIPEDIRSLLSHDAISINAEGGAYGTALQAALMCND
jgi:hypothetical protein